MNKKKSTPVSDKNYIGIDYGGTNIGVALGRNDFVIPLKVINGKNQNKAISDLIRIALENKVEEFVVGLPLTAEGKETAQSLKNRHFAKMLKIISKKKVIFCNEEGSTQEAFRSLVDMGIEKRKKILSDDVAAAVILKRFFEEHL